MLAAAKGSHLNCDPIRNSIRKGSVDELKERKGSSEEVRMTKREEGGRMSVSHIDVSMNAPIAIRGPAEDSLQRLARL